MSIAGVCDGILDNFERRVPESDILDGNKWSAEDSTQERPGSSYQEIIFKIGVQWTAFSLSEESGTSSSELQLLIEFKTKGDADWNVLKDNLNNDNWKTQLNIKYKLPAQQTLLVTDIRVTIIKFITDDLVVPMILDVFGCPYEGKVIVAKYMVKVFSFVLCLKCASV